MKILIVDDNATNLSLLRAILESEGHEVFEAPDGVEALSILDRQFVDAVVSDLFMPRMDGYRLCFELRQTERFRLLPFVVYTSTYTSSDDEKLCLDLGVSKYLRKPASSNEIIASIYDAVTIPHCPSFDLLKTSDLFQEYNDRLFDKLGEKDLALQDRTEELRSASDQLRHLLSHSPAVLYTLKIDGENLVPTVVSDNIERLMGVTPAEADYNWWFTGLHPEDRERVLATLADSCVKGGYSLEYRMRHRDGSYRWIEDQNRIVRDESDHPIEMVGVWTDISGRKAAEAELRKSEERFRDALENVELIAMTLDPEGKVTFCNDYLLRLTGWERQDVLGASWFEMFLPEPIDELRNLYFDTLAIGALPAHHENAIKTRLGDLRHVAWNNTTLRDASGRVVGSASIGEDITERKSLQEQLLHSQKMESLGFLAGGLAHDFNNLLTGVLGYAELAKMRLDPVSPVQDDLEEIRKAAERAARLTKQLLTFARKELIEPREENLNELISGLENLIRRLLGETIELVVSPSSALGLVRADPAQIEQVLVNLAVNAKDAMPNGGRLLIDTRNLIVEEPQQTHRDLLEPAEYVVISVSDTGVGMSKSVQDRAFDPFFTTKEKGKGTGLGLSSCYGIVKNAGGRISIYSEIDRGTTFRIYLPRIDEVPKSASASHHTQSECKGETILVVEDEEAVRKVTVQALRSIGYTVVEAENGAEALRLVLDHPSSIDVLLTDMVMPGMDGRELSESLGSIRPEIKVLYMSGYTDDAIVFQGVFDRELAFLQKPFSSTQLIRKVREVLDSKLAA